MNETILVVDDNDTNRLMMVDVLTQWGYRTCEAKHGKAVMRMVRETMPDLVLLDVMLPGMNGYEICQQLKQDPKTDRIPVIMLTVLDDSESRTRGISVGADLFISRPPNYSEMHKNIESLLQNRRRYRKMENLDSICSFLDRLSQGLSKSEHERHLAVFGYSKRTAKILGVDDDTIQRMMIGSLFYSLSNLLEKNEGGVLDMTRIASPLNIAPWVERFLEYQKNPTAANAEDKGIVIYYVCRRYYELKKAGNSEEAALSELGKRFAGHSAQTAAFEALSQAISDEAFLMRLKSQSGPTEGDIPIS